MEDFVESMPEYMGFLFTPQTHSKPDASIDPAKATLAPGYTVLITGAGHGIGEYIAKSFAVAKATSIIINSRTVAKLEKVQYELEGIAAENGSTIKVSISVGDATKEKTYVDMKRLLESEHKGRLDCLVCCAGGITAATSQGRLHETDAKDYANVTLVNYLGPYYAARHLMSLMLQPQSTGKLIINIASGAAHMTTMSPATYNISKMAVTRLSQHIGEDYANDGLVCIALHPGAVATPGAIAWVPPAFLSLCVDDITLCGAVCVWFAKEKRAWASGRYIMANWDMEQLDAMKDEIVEKDKLKFRMVV